LILNISDLCISSFKSVPGSSSCSRVAMTSSLVKTLSMPPSTENASAAACLYDSSFSDVFALLRALPAVLLANAAVHQVAHAVADLGGTVMAVRAVGARQVEHARLLLESHALHGLQHRHMVATLGLLYYFTLRPNIAFDHLYHLGNSSIPIN
jgi:hypothetical protein